MTDTKDKYYLLGYDTTIEDEFCREFQDKDELSDYLSQHGSHLEIEHVFVGQEVKLKLTWAVS